MRRPTGAADRIAFLWSAAIVLTVGLHYLWEMAQVPFFANMADMPLLRHALICFVAALGDLAIAAVSYGVAALLLRRPLWALEKNWYRPAAAWILFSLVATVLVERWAVAQGRWTYAPSMPTIAGVGLLPLLQWIAVPLVSLLLFRSMVARRPERQGPARK